MGRYQMGDIDNEQYYQLAKGLFTNPIYKAISPAAKVVYAILKDRMEISRKNGWHDDNGDVFLLFNQDKLAEYLGVTTRSVRLYFQELKDVGLIESVRQGLGKPNKLYIQKCKKCTSRQEENFLSDRKNFSSQDRKDSSEQTGKIFPPSKTNIIKTEKSKTEKSKTNNNPVDECSAEFALALKSFEEHRKKLHKPMTDRAKELLLAKLSKLGRTEQEQIAILNQSILNGWQGVFPLGGEKKSYNRPTAADMADDVIKMMGDRGYLNDGTGEEGNSEDFSSMPSWFPTEQS